MTGGEFDRWLVYHTDAYPGLKTWLAHNSGQLIFWEKNLKRYNYQECVAATDKLVGSDDQPRGYTDHPRVIARLARDLRSAKGKETPNRRAYIDGNRVFDCPLCQDTGFVYVVAPKSMRKAVSGEGDDPIRYCNVACTCPHGDPLDGNEFTGKFGLIRYVQKCMIRWDEVNFQENPGEAEHFQEARRVLAEKLRCKDGTVPTG